MELKKNGGRVIEFEEWVIDNFPDLDCPNQEEMREVARAAKDWCEDHYKYKKCVKCGESYCRGDKFQELEDALEEITELRAALEKFKGRIYTMELDSNNRPTDKPPACVAEQALNKGGQSG